ncbi:hypothetical protein TWF506_002255 [Arthrobotrys conoides]|uniref:Uncharacterized protein n=1 Tax=Arthrobotrys conoides TaxID=74498 RepID=A0AAN8RRA2_9PEZI
MPLYRAGGTWMSCTCVCKLQVWSWMDQPAMASAARAAQPGIPRCAGVGLRDGAMLLELANSTTLRGLQLRFAVGYLASDNPHSTIYYIPGLPASTVD